MKKIFLILFSIFLFSPSIQAEISLDNLVNKAKQHPVATGAIVTGVTAAAVLTPLIIKDLKKKDASQIRKFLKLVQFASLYYGYKTKNGIKNHPIVITSALSALGLAGLTWYDLSKKDQSLLMQAFNKVFSKA